MPRKSKPSYLYHKPTGQARVRIDGKDIYLGEYGSLESRERYDDLIGEWFARTGDTSRYSLTIDDLCLLYLQHAKQHYRKHGKPTSELHCIQLALRPLIQLHGPTRAREFGPRALKLVRTAMVKAGYVRKSINAHVSRIKRLFKWTTENEYLPVAVYQTLTTIAGLQAGRCDAREGSAVEAVPEDTVMATLTHLPMVVAAMVRLQLVTAARPGEVVSMRPCDLTFGTDGVWVYRPFSHKTEHKEKERRIYIGPAGQEILRPFLQRDPDAFCFSPREAVSQRNAERRANRKSPMTPSQATRRQKGLPVRSAGNHYTKDSYNRAVMRACEQAFGMPTELRKIPTNLSTIEREERKRLASEWRAKFCWSPNQLRHSAATTIREQYGLEAAQVVLGHADPKTTQIYAERDFQTAARIMRVMG